MVEHLFKFNIKLVLGAMNASKGSPEDKMLIIVQMCKRKNIKNQEICRKFRKVYSSDLWTQSPEPRDKVLGLVET